MIANLLSEYTHIRGAVSSKVAHGLFCCGRRRQQSHFYEYIISKSYSTLC